MWLFSSSVGRKFIMSLTGAALVLFVTFHCAMNSVAILWPAAYNQVCAFLGANWYALVASMGLALLFIIHIIYALVLTVQNRAARGKDRYLINKRPAGVEWSSQNMLVLGIVVLAFLGLHLVQFWSKMQLAELRGFENWYTVDGVPVPPASGTLFLQLAFQNIWVPIVYIIAFVALWFHLTHGFWSMFQSIGWDNTKWIPRLKCIGNWWVTIVVALFIIQVVVFTKDAAEQKYINNQKLQEQYMDAFQEGLNESIESKSVGMDQASLPFAQMYVSESAKSVDFANKFAPSFVDMLKQRQAQLEQQLGMMQMMMGGQGVMPVDGDVEEEIDESELTVDAEVPTTNTDADKKEADKKAADKKTADKKTAEKKTETPKSEEKETPAPQPVNPVTE